MEKMGRTSVQVPDDCMSWLLGAVTSHWRLCSLSRRVHGFPVRLPVGEAPAGITGKTPPLCDPRPADTHSGAFWALVLPLRQPFAPATCAPPSHVERRTTGAKVQRRSALHDANCNLRQRRQSGGLAHRWLSVWD